MSDIPSNALVDVCMEDCEHAVSVDVLYFRPNVFSLFFPVLKAIERYKHSKKQNKVWIIITDAKKEEICWISLPDDKIIYFSLN